MSEELTLDIKKFSPTEAELTKLRDECKDLSIQGIEDKNGYSLVDSKRKLLKAKRVEITKTGKAMRDGAIKFQKDVIAKEKELVAIIEPIEKKLQEEQNKIDEIKKMEARKELLPERKEKLLIAELEMTDEELLKLDSVQFTELLNEALMAKSERENQARIQAEEKIERQRQEKEKEKKRQKELKEAEEKAREEEKFNYRKNRLNDLGIHKYEIKINYDFIKDCADEAFEEEIIAIKKEIKQIEEEKERKEKEELEKKKKYREWRESLGWKESEKELWEQRTLQDGSVELWKKIGTFRP